LNPVTPETPLDHDSCTECVAAVTPVPDREMLAGELVALLLTVILPVADPLADGANVEVSVVVCPRERIIPLALLELKPAPATEKFYRDLRLRGVHVQVGMEATGYSRWFERLLAELGFEVWSGDPAEIQASRVDLSK
jgi:hypothetical protein